MATSCVTFISAGCNRLPNCVHWGSNSIIAFGSENCVVQYNPVRHNAAGTVVNLLKGHKGRVHCVKWLECPSQTLKGESTEEIASGAADNSIIVWRGRDGTFEPHTCLESHIGPVTALDAIYIPSLDGGLPAKPRTLIVSASVDSTVKLWDRQEGCEDFELIQTISFGSGFALDVAISLISDNNVPLIALGGDDSKVHLYVQNGKEFVRVQSLRGHEDWIRGLEFAIDDSGDLLLASCSQDCFIRLWRITKERPEESGSIKLKGNTFTIKKKDLEEETAVVTLESLLAGHEQWIYGVHWQSPIYSEKGERHQPMRLLSASMDKTMIIWALDLESGVWVDQVRVGEVGGNTLGLYGCQFSPDGNTILSHGYQGAFHIWTRDSSGAIEGGDTWTPTVTVSGHFQSVQDIAWEPEGSFLLSVSTDQTTRLFAPWRRDEKEETWHEIARPQVHGYDMQCLAMIGRFKFVSGADEKVLRVFEAPVNFLDNFQRITKEKIDEKTLEQTRQLIPEGASVPALGLSNKAIFAGDSGIAPSDREIVHPSDQYTDIFFEPVSLTAPPTEEHLLQNTLWPETQKLYGHGYEIFSVASHPAGTLVASSCKASKPEHATIILWDVKTWRQVAELHSHTLTITQLAFSHSGRYLLSVSRDRTWSLFEEVENREVNDPPYKRIAHTDKKTSVHSRIIWSCSWSHDDKYFATASRDKKIIVWGCHGDYKPSSSLDIGVPITAVNFAPIASQNGSYIVAIGLESGLILIYEWNPEAPENWQKHSQNILGHTMTVKRLRWRPVLRQNQTVKKPSGNMLELASCSADCSLFIQKVSLNQT